MQYDIKLLVNDIYPYHSRLDRGHRGRVAPGKVPEVKNGQELARSGGHTLTVSSVYRCIGIVCMYIDIEYKLACKCQHCGMISINKHNTHFTNTINHS